MYMTGPVPVSPGATPPTTPTTSLTLYGVGFSCSMDLHEGKIEGQCLNFAHNLHSTLRSSCDTPNEENVSTSCSRDPLDRWIEKDRWGRASHIRLIRLEDGGRCRQASCRKPFSRNRCWCSHLRWKECRYFQIK